MLFGSLTQFSLFQGGIKTVVWTDTIQAFIMIAGMIVVCIVGTISAGGVGKVIELGRENGRFNFHKSV